MDLTLCFAYGSNLSTRQMRERCPTARLVATATLRDHRLTFRGRSTSWGGAVATVERSPGDETKGVLYMMRPSDLVRLDRFEGCPAYYERALRTVVDRHGEVWRAHVYALPVWRAAPGRPGARYLGVIAEAYKRFGWDERALRGAATESKPQPTRATSPWLLTERS